MINFKDWLRSVYIESFEEEDEEDFVSWVEEELTAEEIFYYHDKWYEEQIKPIINQ